VNLLDWAGLAATTAGAALLYTLTVLALPFLRRRSSTVRRPTAGNPARHNHLDGAVVCRAAGIVGRNRAGLLLLGLGSLAGLPLRLVAFRYANPVVVRVLVGATILAFAALLGWQRRRGASEFSGPFGMKPGIKIATGLVAGVATASWGWQGRQC